MNPQKLILYYDGACSLCCRKMTWLANKDKHKRLSFKDISAKGFDASTLPVTRFELNSSLHLRTAEGRYVKDLDAIHLAYCAIGLGWLTMPTRIIGIKQLSNYLFTKWKHHIRGGHDN